MTTKPIKQLNKLIDKDLKEKYIGTLIDTSDEMIAKLKDTPKYGRNDEFSCLVNLIAKQQNLIKFLFDKVK
jgi:hypothetical protein